MTHDPEELLRGVPFFRDLDRVSLARLAGGLEEVRLRAGEVLMSEGAKADALYLIGDGCVALTIASEDGEVGVAEVDAPGYFGELGILLERRTATARAAADAVLWRLPRARFEEVVRERPELGLVVARSLAGLLDRRQRQILGAPVVETDERAATAPRRAPPRVRRLHVVGIVAAFAIPAALWPLPGPAGLSVAGWHVIVVLIGAAIAWLAEPVPDFVIAIALAVAWGVLGLAPAATIFGGFATSTWLLALGALALAAGMARSGLLFRTALASLGRFPSTHTGQTLALVIGGAVITPLVPLGVARVAAVARITRELVTAFGYEARSRGSAGLTFAGLVGYWYFSNVFLTGFATNFYVLELLAPADRARFQWLGWLLAAVPAGIVFAIGATAALLILFPPEKAVTVSTDAIRRQRAVLGPVSRSEILTALAAILLIGGVLVPTGVGPEWFALATLVLVASTVIDRAAFRTQLDWGFLMLFGILNGSVGVMQKVGVDKWIASVATTSVTVPPEIAIFGLAIVIALVRIVLPSRPTMLLLGLAFVPVAPALGISGWIAGFVILSMGNIWVLPYQGLEYLMLREATGREAFTDRQGMRIGAALLLVRFVAIAVSLPYWRAIGLIG